MPGRKGEHSPTRALGRALNVVSALSGRGLSGKIRHPTGIFPTDTRAEDSAQQPDIARA
jgi:hypothetical protein